MESSVICKLLLQLENYAKTEEAKVEELIKAVADSGAKVIVSGGAVGDMALHFCERYKWVASSSEQFCAMLLFVGIFFRLGARLYILYKSL